MLIDERDEIMNEAIQNLIGRIVADYNDFTNRVADGELSERNLAMMAEFEEKVDYKVGNKYIRIFQNNSVWGFIVNTENDKQFAKGDILMAAGYNKPARNKARGNVFDLENLRVQWTGANYL
jgi:hypothetical protein